MGKTGGVTIGKLLAGLFPIDRFISGGTASTNSALGLQQEENVRRKVEAASASMDFDRPTLIAGHIPIPHTPYLRGERYFTIVREPIDRAVSSYSYLRNQDGPVFDIIRKLSLEEYVDADISLDVNNYQTRILCGDRNLDGDFNGLPISSIDLVTTDSANQALTLVRDRFVFVGVFEQFEETVILLRRFLGAPIAAMNYKIANKTPNRAPLSSISETTLRKLRARNQADLELYKNLLRQFEELKARQGLSFRLECQGFKVGRSLNLKGLKAPARLVFFLLDRIFRRHQLRLLN